jgi:hypothetical protein
MEEVFSLDIPFYRTRVISNMQGSMAKYVGSVNFRKRRRRKPHECDTASMTALVSAHTPEGFVVGADSLRLDLHNNIVTETATKLHPTNHLDFWGAYGFSGHTALEYSDQRPMFDVLRAASSIAEDFAEAPLDSPQKYVEDFCWDLADRIVAASTGFVLPSEEVFLRTLFVGYHRGQSLRFQVLFSTVNGCLQSPILKEMIVEPNNDFCVVSGSSVVWDELTLERDKPETLREGIEFVRDYLTRCIENKTDPH